MKASASSAEARFGAKPPSSPTLVLWPASFSCLLQGVEDLRAHAQAFGEALGAGRQDHELLDVDRIVGVGAAVDDVHHRHRQDAGRDAADILVERQADRDGAGLGRGQDDAEDGVGAQAALVRRCRRASISGLVDAALVLGVDAGQGVEDLAVDGVDRLAGRPCRRSGPCRRRAVSTASWAPVEAPEGTAARPKAPSSSITSTSTVGLPRLSRISRATMSTISVMGAFEVRGSAGVGV